MFDFIHTEALQVVEILLKKSKAAIFPFTEQPAAEKEIKVQDVNTGISAVELFSIFTADIIKEEIVFTR